jgi:predicted outer membrane protein
MTKHTRFSSRRIVTLLMTVAALSLVGPVAMAQASDTTKAQYDNDVTKVAAGLGSGGDGPAALQKKVVHGLPFTGLDVVAMLAVAVTSMGLALRRLTAERHLS